MTNQYYYRVDEHLMVLGTDKKFAHSELFKNGELPVLRKKAIEYLRERQAGIEKRGHFYGAKLVPYSEDVKFGEDAAYSINLVLVVESDDIEEHILYGEDEETTKESLKLEQLVYQQLGI